MGRKKNFKTKQKFSIPRIFPEIFFHPEVEFWWAGGVFCIFKCVFSRNYFHHELLPHRRFQLSKFCIYGHKISQGYSIMTDNLKNPVHLGVVCYCFSVFSGAVEFTLFRESITCSNSWFH